MISLREQLSRRPGGSLRSPLLSWPEVATYIREHATHNEREKKRMERAAQRQRFYQCRGDDEMWEMVQTIYASETAKLRRPMIEFTKYSNFCRRAVNEIATVYAAPAKRTVSGEENNAHYQEVQRLSRQDEVMQRINRMGFLQRALAVGPRMRQSPRGVWEPTIDVVTPAKFHALRDPLDPTQYACLVFENDFALAGVAAPDAPRWTIAGWNETMYMSSNGEILESTIVEEECRWLLLTLEPPDGRLIDEDTGEDLIAATKNIWFLHLHHLKESRDSTVQTIVQGDVSNVTRDQINDTSATGVLPEGAVVTTIDRGMDVTIFTRGAQYVAETAGANYGIAPSVMRGESVTSADAREMQRLPLRELRLQQQIPFRAFERELARVQSMVVGQYATERPDLQFTAEGWSLNFADPQTPLGTKESLEVYATKRKLGLTSTIKQAMETDPDLDRDGAKDEILQNIVDELWRNVHMRPLQQISGSPAAEQPGGDIPAEPGDEESDESRDGASTAPVGDDADKPGDSK